MTASISSQETKKEVKYLSEFYHLPEFKTLDGYKKNGGYIQLEKALKMRWISDGNEVGIFT
jgi:hypothetical protein